MSISGPFIHRPVATTLVMLGILLFGVLAYRVLPVSDLPNVDYPVITVRASLPGASPETMASAVATPLEKQFSTIAGLDAMTSTSSLGSTNITLQFILERDIDTAAQDVQAAIAQVLRQLPLGILPPSYQKSNPADSPILYFALTSDQLPLSTLDEYAQTFLAQRISTVAGVAQVNVFGSQKYAVRVRLKLFERAGATVVPAVAVTSSQQGPYCYVVKPDTTVEVRPVTVELTWRELAVITSGVRAGETVVTDG